MFVNFKDVFKEDNYKIPKEIIEALNENATEGLEYKQCDNDICVLVGENLNIKLEFEKPEGFTGKTSKELLDYSYRTQKPLKIINNDFYIKDKPLKMEDIIKSPFKEMKWENGEFFLHPRPFKPFFINIEGNGIVKELEILRQPCEDMNKMLFRTTDNSPIILKYVIEESKGDVKFNMDIDIDLCKSVQEAIEVLKIYKSLFESNLKILGAKINNTSKNDDAKIIEEMIDLYEKVLKIEFEIDIHFKPKKEIDSNDVYIIEGLYKNLIEKVPYKEYCYLSNLKVSNDKQFNWNELIDKEGIGFTVNSIEEVNILGIKIKLPSITGLFSFKIKEAKVIKEDEVFEYQLVIDEDEQKKMYKSILYFKSEEDRDLYISDNNVQIILKEADPIS